MMKLFRILCILLFCSSVFSLHAQKYTVSGYVREEATGEELIGANVFVTETKKGTITNHYGFYSLTLPQGEYNLNVSFIGYANQTMKIKLVKNISLNISLSPTAFTTREVVVQAEKPEQNVESAQMSSIRLSMEKVKILPSFMGETDILKTIQLLPGVQSAGEGNSGFYVRGGGPDQNLILLDEAIVYNASHLFGFFSVFNADAVKDVNLIKGGMPAQYGGRLSSVLDISMKEGNNKQFRADGGIGVVSSRLTLQGPIKKDTSSFIISGRRTYIDILVEPFIKNSSPFKGSGYYFYDLNAKINYRFSDKNRLYLSGYFGRDVFSYKNKEHDFNARIPWGNATATLRWNHLFSNKLFMNTTLLFSDYRFEMGMEQERFEFRLFSGITDYSLKTDFSYLPDVRHSMKFGVECMYHIFLPSSISARIGETDFDSGKILKNYAQDMAAYFNDEFDATDRIKLSGGLRVTYFAQLGPFDRFLKDIQGNNTDTIHYNPWENVASYQNIEPRFSVRYSLNATSSLKASYTYNYQYIHMASISSVSLPTDLWVPSSSIVKPQEGAQYAAGYFKNMGDNQWETSAEVYYKTLKNLIEYKEGSMPEDDVGDNPDYNFTFGSGYSYGMEFFIKKSAGNTNGWFGYTISKTMRRFPELNLGEEFPAKYDRRHDLALILTHTLKNQKWTFSMVFEYSTGNCLTLPIARYLLDGGNLFIEYGERNSYRMDNYHRLDLSATYYFKKNKRFESSLNISVYNVYCRYNPYFIYFDYEGDIFSGNFAAKAYQVSLFPTIPSVTWNFTF